MNENQLLKSMLPFQVIWLNGMPRSGTNWLSQIFDSNEEVNFKLAPLFSYAFKDGVNSNSSLAQWIQFFTDVYNSGDPFVNQQQKRDSGAFPVFKGKKRSPRFLVIKDTRNHNLFPALLEKFHGIKVIYIVRNPCGAIYSWLNNPKEFPANADSATEWKTGKCRKVNETEFWGFDDWKLLTEKYLKLQNDYPHQVMVVSYEKLVDDPLQVTQQMFDFAGLELTEATRSFLVASQSVHSDNDFAVFKNKEVKDKWKLHLSEKIKNEIFRELRGTILEKYLD